MNHSNYLSQLRLEMWAVGAFSDAQVDTSWCVTVKAYPVLGAGGVLDI